MSKSKRPHVYLLLDKSGSMAERWEEIKQSIDTYVAGLGETDPFVTLTTFSEEFGPNIRTHPAVRASDWEGITATPNGRTPLYDAIASVVNVALRANPPRAAIVVITDGYENASRTTSKQSAKMFLDQCRAKDWEVLFMGADFDAMPQAHDLGVIPDKVLNMAKGFYGSGMVGMSASTQSYFGTGEAVAVNDNLRARSVGKAS